MPIKDRNGCLHSEANGRFISKNKGDDEKRKAAERIYGTSNELNYDQTSVYGALDWKSDEAEEHAERYYEFIRHRKDDVEKISNNTVFSKEQIQRIKEHIFLDEHDLENGRMRFYASYEMAQSWQRLCEGKSIREMDIVLLNHELLEIRYIEQGYSQSLAHKKSEEKYNYSRCVKELHAKEEK